MGRSVLLGVLPHRCVEELELAVRGDSRDPRVCVHLHLRARVVVQVPSVQGVPEGDVALHPLHPDSLQALCDDGEEVGVVCLF